MEIAKQIAGFSPAEADDLRKAIGKKIHSLMASLKSKFLEGCAASGHGGRRRAAALGRHGAGAGLLVQQVARRLLRADLVPHRVAAREPPARVHGGAHLLGDEHEGQGAVLRRRVRRARDRGAAAGRERVAGRLRRRRGEDPLRAQRGEERRRGHLPRDRRGAGGGRAVRLDLGLHRARRPVGREQALARVARLERRARLDRRVADGDAPRPRGRALLRPEAAAGPAARPGLDLRPRRLARRVGAPPRHDPRGRVREVRAPADGEGEPRPLRLRASAQRDPRPAAAPHRLPRSPSSSGGARARPSSRAASSPACGRRRRRRASRWRSSSSRT